VSEPRKNRFENNPRLVLGVLYSMLGLFLLVGSFFLVKAVRDEAKRGVERYIVLRERKPDSDIPQTPSQDLAAIADGLERKPYPFRADADGYIMPSQVHQKPDLTVVFLGGSTTECTYMQQEERFPYLVGRQLEKSLGGRVNTLNGGCAGNNTLHSLLVLQAKVLPRRPQAVVLMECINDLNFMMIMGDYWTPHASRGIVFDKEYGPVKRFILTHLAGRTALSGSGGDESADARGRRLALDIPSLTAAYRKNLEHFIFLSRQHGIIPVLMTQFNRYTASPDDNVLRQMQGWNVNYAVWRQAYEAMQNTLRAVAVEQKVALIDLERLVPKTKEYMYDGVHLNTGGAALVAGLVAERLPEILRRDGGPR